MDCGEFRCIIGWLENVRIEFNDPGETVRSALILQMCFSYGKDEDEFSFCMQQNVFHTAKIY